MSDWKKISPGDLDALPVTLRKVIPDEYLDEFRHMNVMWYTHLFSMALDGIFDRVGLTAAYFETNQAGTFAMENHVRYFNEVRVGQRVTIRTRLIGHSEKRFHLLHFMTNDANSLLAATSEIIGSHVDLRIRRSSTFPAEIAAAIDRLQSEHARLPWPAPLCGAMRV